MTKKEIFKELNKEEKARLFTGKNMWELEPINGKSIFLSDGPHGIRKEYKEDRKTKTVKAVCYPTASLTACSFDKSLMEEFGRNLAKEAIYNKVDVLLGPGINIKRNPLCGRNFEYFSEDPYLAGNLAAAYINGCQSKNVGVSLKHFAANSQEEARFISDSIVDERALREIYLKGFEIAIKASHPWTIMASYNKINGVRATENKKLLTEICRNEFGFDGIFMSDWGAIDGSVEALAAGLDLEMPGLSKGSNRRILKAIANKKLGESILDESTNRLIDLYLKTEGEKRDEFNKEDALDFATKLNEESIVLLKNENNILPLSKNDKLLLVGDFVKNPRYQGGGSSQINPYVVTNLYDELTNDNISFSYARGYKKESLRPNKALIKEAVEKAKLVDKVVILMGLPRIKESEGYDRSDLNIPDSHLELVKEISKANKNIIVILQNGSPVVMPSINDVKGLIEAYLGGSMGSRALKNILYGKVNPSGRLAESFPLNYSDVVSSNYYLKHPNYALYKESIYVGYRYYDTFNVPVLFPFGYGLSYSDISYSDYKIERNKKKIIVSFKLTNNSDTDAKEVVSIYVGLLKPTMFRAKKELKAFDKISISAHEVKECKLEIAIDDLKYYDINSKSYKLEEGNYRFYLAKNVSDEANYLDMFIESHDKVKESNLDIYYLMNREVSDTEFSTLLAYKPNLKHKIRPYTTDSPLKDFYYTITGFIAFKLLANLIITLGFNKYDRKMIKRSMPNQPIRTLQMVAGISKEKIEGIVDLYNFHYLRGIKKIFSKAK